MTWRKKPSIPVPLGFENELEQDLQSVPTSLGASTAGSYEWYFDGSDVGLTTNGEDIDAIGFAPDGRLLVSTASANSVLGVSTSDRDEDLLAFVCSATARPTATAASMLMESRSVNSASR